MRYRVCKSFEIESGHMLSKHPGRCRYPHGHSRRVEIVVSSERLDASDMVCDFKAIKLAVAAYLDSLDHAMMVNAADPFLKDLEAVAGGGRLVLVEGEDPTTEVLARLIYERVAERIRTGAEMVDDAGNAYRLSPDVLLERVRVSETSSSWAEYGL